MTTDETFMRVALDEAAKGRGFTAPNPAVGAVVVKDGRIIGRGFHARAGEPHAEPQAIRDAGEAVRGAEMYVTLEPCCTQGRTPPCTEAILKAGIRRLIVGCTDPNPAHAGRAYRILREAGVEVVENVLRADCEDMIAGFAHVQRTGLPFVSLKLAVSLDGRIADGDGISRWITGEAARDKVQALRRRVDAVLAGTETLLRDNPSLQPRPDGGRRPWRLLPDRRGRLPLDLKVFTDEFRSRSLCLLGAAAAPARRAELDRLGIAWLDAPEAGGHFAWTDLLRLLAKRGMQHILCEGGGQLAAALLREGLVQELHWVQAPILLGSGGIPAIDFVTPLTRAPRLEWLEEERLGDDLWQRFRIPGGL